MQNELDIVRDVSLRLDTEGIGYIEQWTPQLDLVNLWKEIA
jgi:hypothetical protein